MSIIYDALRKAKQERPTRPVEAPVEKGRGSSRGEAARLEQEQSKLLERFRERTRVYAIGYWLSGIMMHDIRVRVVLIVAGVVSMLALCAVILQGAETRDNERLYQRIMTNLATNVMATVADVVAEHLPWATPRLVCTGIMHDNRQPLCIVNGTITARGETVRGARLIDIRSHEIVLKYHGRLITVPVTKR